MSLKVKTRKLDGGIVVDMHGRITSGEPQWLLRETVRRLVDDGSTRFVLNLSDVSYIDSAGLGELASIKSVLDERDGQVNLLGVTRKVRDVLVVTKLVVVFDSFDHESEAVAALQTNRSPQAATVGAQSR